MRTFQFPIVISNSLLVGSLALATATPLAAAEPASSVNFVNRDALTTTNGWRNPLRSGTSADDATSGNSLRPTVTPVSYDADAASPDDGYTRAPNGLQLRPHTQSNGIFSGFLGDGSKSQTKARTAPAPANQSSFRQPQLGQSRSKPMPPKSAAQQALSMMPQFQSSAARKQSQAAAASQAMTSARAGSAMQHTAQAPTQQSAARSNAQASYNTAAAAQAYRHNSPPPGATATARRPYSAAQPTPGTRANVNAAHLSRPTISTSRPTLANEPRLSATPTNPTSADASSPAGLLTQAHQLAETARSEADFSKIFAMCQQIPASQASGEEAAFGRQLAAWSLNRRGQLRARAGNSEAAMADFALAIRVDAKCWRALHNRGVLLAQTGQFEPAFDDFHHAIELNPTFAKAYANRAALYVLADEVEPGLADYQRAVDLDPNFAIAHRGCGRVCHMLGRMDEAFEQLSQAIELAPQDASALASLGDLLTDLGEYAAAADDYERALAVNPKYADACRGSAWLLATCPDGEVRNPGVALERAQMAVELERKADATTLDTLAAAQASVGDFQSATQTIRRAIELAPPSERSAYQDRMQMYRQSKPFRIEPLQAVHQAGYER
ncbi:MAG: tetratricopeptide repeat protein [Pirellulales bacterium]